MFKLHKLLIIFNLKKQKKLGVSQSKEYTQYILIINDKIKQELQQLKDELEKYE